MSEVKSKNPYELLGNTSDQDSDREPPAPQRTVEKPNARTGKRDATRGAHNEAAPSGTRGGRGGRRGGFAGSEDAFRDRNTSTTNHRGKPTDDGLRQDRHSDRLGGGRGQGNYEGRGARGSRGGRGGRGNRDDRHSRSGITEHTKQIDQSWGAPTGKAEWNDEKAGDAIAASEVQDMQDSSAATGAPAWDEGAIQGAPGFNDSAGGGTGGDNFGADAVESEPEDKNISYADWLASQSERKQAELGPKEPRKPVEKKGLENAKPVSRENDEYMSGAAAGNRRGKDKRQKDSRTRVDLDLSWQSSGPEVRGGGRGGRGERRGGDRGGRGEYRGRGRGDGEYRGRGARGSGRGRGGTDSHHVAVDDESAFPVLGA